jgi:hypothetical protein
MRRYRRDREDSQMDVSLAVCVLKYDVWKPLIDHHECDGRTIVDATSVRSSSKKGFSELDLTEINIISGIVRNLLSDTCPQFVALAESHFKHVRYFPVSSLGHSPSELDGFLKIRPIDIRSFRVDHPFLWLMYRWRMIPASSNKEEHFKHLPFARVKPSDQQMIIVTCPNSGARLMLDRDHIGRRYYNPATSEFFWIPRVENEVHAPAPVPQRSRAPEGQPRSGLTLPDPSTKASNDRENGPKGWWPFR